MDLDTAIDKVRELATAWSTTGASHQHEMGDAMVTVVNAAVQWQAFQATPVVLKTPPKDPFLVAAEASANHQLAGKPHANERQEDTRKVGEPLAAAEGDIGGLKTVGTEGMSSGTMVLIDDNNPDKAVVATGLAAVAAPATAMGEALAKAADAKPRRHAKKSHG